MTPVLDGIEPRPPASGPRTVPLLDLAPQNGPLRAEIEAAVGRLLDSNRYILGPETGEFESAIAAYLGVPEAIGCANGTDALILSLLALGIGPGDGVLVPSFTFFATAGAVSRCGATPVFADISPMDFNLDPRRLEEAARRHGRIRAVIAVHLFGGAAPLGPLGEIARRNGWALIEDAAQAIGAEHDGTRCPGPGVMGTLSFFPSKNLGAFGDAGLVVTHDAALAERLRALRVHGSRRKYLHEWVGFNSRLDTLQAAILNVKLRHLDEWTAARARNAARYHAWLAPLNLPLTLPVPAPWQSRHVWNQFTIRTPRRDELKTFLADRGIGTEIYYPLPLHLQPCYAEAGYREGDLPESERASREALSLPIHSGLAPEDVGWVVESLKAFFAGQSSIS